MSISADLLKKTKESLRWLEMISPDYYGVGPKKDVDGNTGEPVRKIVPAAPPANLVITEPEIFLFQEINGFFFKRNVLGNKDAALEKQKPFQDVPPSNGVGNVVQSTALQFNDVDAVSALLASNGAPESLPDRSGEMRSLLQENGLRNRPLMV
ncbi:hypothetical protein KTQ42_06740|uniref:hypothetical protein n=1 Tax=Noviherbaspirillum sp. L7-7A TaxID=2850560 RepID=UPI001C2C7390|nr:hypothetical protein [Noviherbaspirillum sp. L7-7A]MBV0879002.1 hypothetical protein [Noviherbaspirillum sp. L7-7A]